MQRELWTREDLRNALLAAYFAGVVAPGRPEDRGADAYIDGFRAALTALALNFGLPVPLFPGGEPGSTRRGSLGANALDRGRAR
jgi:hypothetical protein